MFAKTLINLIDQAIFPAVLIVTAKIVGIVFFAKYFDADFTVNGLRLVFTNLESFTSINTYSSLFMFIAVVGGLLWVVIKAHVFHDTHISPALSVKIVSMNLEELIHSTRTIYIQSFVWLSYAWLTAIIFGVQSFFGLSLWWLFWVSLAVSVVTTALLVVDLEREIEKDKEDLLNNDQFGKVVTFQEVRKEMFN